MNKKIYIIIISIIVNFLYFNDIYANYSIEDTVQLKNNSNEKKVLKLRNFTAQLSAAPTNYQLMADMRYKNNWIIGLAAGYNYTFFLTNYYHLYDVISNNDIIKVNNNSLPKAYDYQNVFVNVYARYTISKSTYKTYDIMPYINTYTYLELNTRFNSYDLFTHKNDAELNNTYRVGVMLGRHIELGSNSSFTFDYGLGLYEMINYNFTKSTIQFDIRLRLGVYLYKTNY